MTGQGRGEVLEGGWSAPRSGRFTRRLVAVPIVQEARWASGPVWTENLAPPTGFDPRTVPVCSEYLYRLSYPGCQRVTQQDYDLFT